MDYIIFTDRLLIYFINILLQTVFLLSVHEMLLNSLFRNKTHANIRHPNKFCKLLENSTHLCVKSTSACK